MRVVARDFLNNNEFNKYPIDESASYEPYPPEEQVSINCILSDMSITLPDTVASSLYVSRIAITPALISMTIMGVDTHPFDAEGDYQFPAPSELSSEYSAFGAYVVATVQATRSANMAGVTVDITPNVDGVGGWITFGSGASKEGIWSFAGPESSMISDHCVTRYKYGGVKTIGKLGFQETLDGKITVIGQNGIEVVNDDSSISLQFSGTQQEAKESIQAYIGACGGRPESGTCTYSPIKTINGISPQGPDSKIVLVLDRPLYGILEDAGTEEEVFIVYSDVTLESFCRNRINIPGDCETGLALTNVLYPPDTGGDAPQPDPSVPLLLEVYGGGSYSSSKFSYVQQSSDNLYEAIYRTTGSAVIMGEQVNELRIDTRRREWQAYTSTGVSMSAFGYLGSALSGKKTVTMNGSNYDIYLGVPSILDDLDMVGVQVSIDAPDSFEEQGSYYKTGKGVYTHSSRPEYVFELRGSRQSWIMHKSNVVIAAGTLSAAGEDSQIQEYKRATGESSLRTILVKGIK